MINSALIYAAGFGTRMRELTQNHPKPLLPLGGRAIIDHIMADARREHIHNFWVNTHYHADQLHRHFQGQQDVLFLNEPDGPYETGGTLKAFADRLPNAIFTLNSDVIWPVTNPIQSLRDHWGDRWDALIALVPRERDVIRGGAGDFHWDGQNLRRRGEAKQADFIYSGWQIIRPQIAVNISDHKFSTNLIWDQLIANGRIGAIIHDAPWIDIGTMDAYEYAQSEFGGMG